MAAYQVIVDLIQSDFRNHAFGDSLEANSITRILDQQKLASYLAFSYVNDKKKRCVVALYCKRKNELSNKEKFVQRIVKAVEYSRQYWYF